MLRFAGDDLYCYFKIDIDLPILRSDGAKAIQIIL